MARFGPILIKQLLNVFDMSVLPLMISSLHVNYLVKVLFVCVQEIIFLIGSHVCVILVLEGRKAHFPFFFLSFHKQIQQSQALSD